MSAVQQVMLAQKIASGSNITADLWCDFEFATVSAANLNTSSHGATGTWTLPANTGPTFTTSASGEQHMVSTVNTTTDNGTLGWQWDCTQTAADYAQYDMAANKTTVSIGFWLIQNANLNTNRVLLRCEDNIGGSVENIQLSTGSQMRFGDNGVSHNATLSANTPYWINIQFVKNGTCTMRVFNASGVEQGTAATTTGGNKNIRRLYLGNYNATTSGATGNIWMDDLIMDETSSTYPFGP